MALDCVVQVWPIAHQAAGGRRAQAIWWSGLGWLAVFGGRKVGIAEGGEGSGRLFGRRALGAAKVSPNRVQRTGKAVGCEPTSRRAGRAILRKVFAARDEICLFVWVWIFVFFSSAIN